MEIGQIINPLTGTIVEHVRATATGFLFTIRAYPVCYEGSLLARIQTRNYNLQFHSTMTTENIFTMQSPYRDDFRIRA